MLKIFPKALVLGVLVASTPVLAEPLAMNFAVNVGGMSAMKLSFAGDVGKSSYQARVKLKPNGFAGLFIKKAYDLRVRGRFNDAHARPMSFSMTIKKKGKVREGQVRWKGKRIVWTRKPPYEPQLVRALR
jgi:hypothetical protein